MIIEQLYYIVAVYGCEYVAHGGDARVHIYTATALERGRVASPTRGRFYPVENPPALML